MITTCTTFAVIAVIVAGARLVAAVRERTKRRRAREVRVVAAVGKLAAQQEGRNCNRSLPRRLKHEGEL